ncbi:MAG TPA: prepilin-type N-terminal cleavage/methylation domain-containing protein, partial [Pantanalinema sp.]
MEKAIVQASRSRPQSGFTLVELVIGSAAFLVILTSAVMMLTQWMKATGESDRAIEATDNGAKAISQIASDIRMATYLYHYATVSISGDKFANFGVQTLPIVTQTDNDADLPPTRQKAYFAAKGTSELMGVTSAGARNVLAMISDQPYGISKPRYIVYWLDDSAAEKAKNQIVRYRADGVEEKYYLLPLYRLEASPSANVDATPTGWYTFGDKLTDAGTSSLY